MKQRKSCVISNILKPRVDVNLFIVLLISDLLRVMYLKFMIYGRHLSLIGEHTESIYEC